VGFRRTHSGRDCETPASDVSGFPSSALRTLHIARHGRRGNHFPMDRAAPTARIEIARIVHDRMEPRCHVPSAPTRAPNSADASLRTPARLPGYGSVLCRRQVGRTRGFEPLFSTPITVHRFVAGVGYVRMAGPAGIDPAPPGREPGILECIPIGTNRDAL